MKRNIIALLVFVMMCLSILPMGALAADFPFTDVKASDWFYGDVKNAYEMGLINGKSATSFAPDASLTYAEAVKLAACMHRKYTVGSAAFESSNPWYQSYVDYAKANEIIDTDYSWNETATRAGYIGIFANALPDGALAQMNTVDDGMIPDVPMTHADAGAIYKLYRAGIMQGIDANYNCNPEASIKRSEVSAILTRMMDPSARKTFTITNGDTKDKAEEQTAPLTVALQPQDVTAAKGDSVVLSVTVTGGKLPYTYQWYCDLAPLLSETDSSVTFGPINNFTATYFCVITDANGSSVTTDKVKLTEKVTAPPMITAQPQNVTAAVDETAVFAVAADGGRPPYSYQWEHRFLVEGTYGDWLAIEKGTRWASGQNSVSLSFTVNKTEFTYAQQYRCIVTDANGKSVASEAAWVVERDVALAFPIITAQPKVTSGAVGENVAFTVTAAGGKEPYSYQWEYRYLNDGSYIDWRPIASDDRWAYGQNTATLRFAVDKGEYTDAFQYRCIVTDANGSQVKSKVAWVIAK